MSRKQKRLEDAVIPVLVLMIVISSTAALLALMPRAEAYSGIDINLQRPAFAGSGQTVQLKLTIAGGPAGDFGGNFTYTASVTASNDTGSSITPSSGTSAKGDFILNLTMPTEAPQKVTVSINATSTAGTSGNPSTFLVREFTIEDVVPVVLRATVFNTGSVDAKNVTARFYADGVLLNTQVVNVSAFGSAVLSYNWTFLRVSSGKHVITVTVNDPAKLVEFSGGNDVISQVIFIGKQGNPAGAILTIGVIILAVLVVLMYLQKPVKRGKSPGVR